MTTVRVSLVDVYPLRFSPAGLEALVLRRAAGGRCPGSWEAVHGHVEDGETSSEAAWREVVEETGLQPERLYNLSRVEAFYLHRADLMAVVPAFAAFVAPDGAVTLSAEHDAFEWLGLGAARVRCAWPRIRRALDDAEALLGSGSAGDLEDVLRVDPPGPRG